MKALILALAAVLAGFVASFILVIAVEFFSSIVHPLPKNFGGTPEEMCLHVARYPQWVLAVVVPAWAAVAFVGTWTARKIGNWHSALTLGLMLMAALILNLSMLPYPIWFKVANLIVIPAAILVGSRPPFPRRADKVPCPQ